jgi:hypothetical protein
MTENPDNGSTTDRGVCAPDAETDATQPLAAQQDSAAAETASAHILPTEPPSAPFEAVGTVTEPGRTVPTPVCKCGAPAHPTKPDICAKGHAWVGNQRTRVNPLEALDDDEADEPIDHVQMAEDALRLLRREYKKLRRHLRLNLTTSARRAARKDLRELGEEILQHAKFLESVVQSRPRPASGPNILARLSDATLAVVLKDLGAERLEDVVEYADMPLPLRVELTDSAHEDHNCSLQHVSSVTSSQGQPDAIAQRWIDKDVTFAPHKTGPILAVSNAPKPPPNWPAEKQREWELAHYGMTCTTSEDEPMPPGPAIAGIAGK